MKKINFMFGAIALVAGMTLSSCASDDETAVVKEVKAQAAKQLTVSSNVEATFSFAGETKTGTSATFNTTANSGKLVVTAQGYISQESEINFGENGTASVSVELAKLAANEVDQRAAKGNTVYGAANEWGAVAGIEVPADVEISGTNKPFSVASYETTGVIDANALTVDQTVSGAVLTLDCQPSGAKFSKPVTISAAIPEGISTGFEFVAKNGSDVVPARVEGNTLKADVEHFSPWSFMLTARILRIVSGSELIQGVAPVRPGANGIYVPVRRGWIPADRNLNPAAGIFRMLGSFLRNLFGNPANDQETQQYTVTIEGSRANITYGVVYRFKDITFISGGQVFTIRVYTGISIEIVNVEPVHSGGASLPL